MAVCWFGQRLKERPSGPIRSVACGRRRKLEGAGRRGNYRHRPLEVMCARCLRELTRAVESNLQPARPVVKIYIKDCWHLPVKPAARQIENYDEVDSRGSAGIFMPVLLSFQLKN